MLSITITGVPDTVAELEQKIDKFISATAQELKDQLVPRTPIDTGRARRGWQNRQFAKTQVVENQVPYIGVLEKGRSKQAPNGFVNQAVSATVAEMKRKKL